MAGQAAPRGSEASGLAAPAYAMGCLLHLAAWALVAAVPCPDRGGALQANHLPAAPPRAAFPWAPPLLALQERLAEEGKRKDRRNSCGLLREIHALEKCAQRLAEAIRGGYFGPFTRPSLTSPAVKDLFKGANVQRTKTQISDVLQTISRSSVCSAQIIVLRVSRGQKCHKKTTVRCNNQESICVSINETKTCIRYT